MKAIQFIYQEMEINFLIGNKEDLKVNATEMAKIFNKEIKDFMRLSGTKEFIELYIKSKNDEIAEKYTEDPPYISIDDVVTSKQKSGTYMNRILALKFAAWLDTKFELWIYEKIEELLFGNYKKHWDAYVKQEEAKVRMAILKKKMLNDPTQADVIAYFEAEREFEKQKMTKLRAIRDQYQIDFSEPEENDQL